VRYLYKTPLENFVLNVYRNEKKSPNDIESMSEVR